MEKLTGKTSLAILTKLTWDFHQTFWIFEYLNASSKSKKKQKQTNTNNHKPSLTMSSIDVPETFMQIFKTCILLQNMLTGDSRFV